MKNINYDDIVLAVKELCFRAAYDLPEDVETALKNARNMEESSLGKDILQQCIENAEIARAERVPLCQDTGFAVFFVKLGQNVNIDGGLLGDAIDEGVRQGYRDGFLRKSLVDDPLFKRVNTGDNTPSVIHIDIVEGEDLHILLAPKGGGSENMSKIAMLKPSDGVDGVVDFVVKSVVQSGGNPCPPTIVGVGVGGTFEKCAALAKKALLRPLGQKSVNPLYADLEDLILEKINSSGVGPQGLGGRVTALAVHIEYHPCHIAQLPVAVNLNCHAARHAEVVL